MSLSKSHATLDYLDTFMSVSWRREYIFATPAPPPSVKNKQTTTISKQNTNECVCGKMDGN